MLSEQYANYPCMILKLKPHYRLIECRDSYQWILQKKDKNKERWRGVSYFLFKAEMERVFLKHKLELTVVDHLSDRFQSQYKTGQGTQRVISEAGQLEYNTGSPAKSFSHSNKMVADRAA